MATKLEVRFGGEMGEFVDQPTKVALKPRCFGSLTVEWGGDPAQNDALTEATRQGAIQILKTELLPQATSDFTQVLGSTDGLGAALAQRLNAEAGPQGIHIEVTQLSVAISGQETDALMQARQALGAGAPGAVAPPSSPFLAAPTAVDPPPAGPAVAPAVAAIPSAPPAGPAVVTPAVAPVVAPTPAPAAPVVRGAWSRDIDRSASGWSTNIDRGQESVVQTPLGQGPSMLGLQSAGMVPQAPQRPVAPQPAGAGKVCPKCGAAAGAADRFCSGCGGAI